MTSKRKNKSIELEWSNIDVWARGLANNFPFSLFGFVFSFQPRKLEKEESNSYLGSSKMGYDKTEKDKP